MQRSRIAQAAGALVAVASGGCTGTVVSSADASSAATYALLAVDRSEPAGAADAARAHASARFLRISTGADPSRAARLLGAVPEMPGLGTCAPVDALADPGIPLASLGPVDLVPAGELSVEADGARATLAARAFPDVVDLVSGLVYTTRDVTTSALPTPARYRFVASGSEAIGPTVLEADAPPAPLDVRVAGAPLGADPAAIARADLTLAWTPGAAADHVYVDLAGTDDPARERVRCAFADDGAATIPAAALPAGTSIAFALHRVHREPVTAPGLDGGEVRFDLATTGSLRVE